MSLWTKSSWTGAVAGMIAWTVAMFVWWHALSEEPEGTAEPQQDCWSAPAVALELDRLRPAAVHSNLWACGVRLGDEHRWPAYLCYRMRPDCSEHDRQH